MELLDISTPELIAELHKRSEEKKSGPVLVFGTIGVDNKKSFVEIFKEIKTESDLNFLKNASLRARFNPQRYYRGFYFKTDSFKELKNHYEQDGYSFGKWVESCSSINFINL